MCRQFKTLQPLKLFATNSPKLQRTPKRQTTVCEHKRRVPQTAYIPATAD